MGTSIRGGPRTLPIPAAELVNCSPEVITEYSPAKRGSRRLNLHNAATCCQRPELLPRGPAGRATDLNRSDSLQPPEQPPPVPAQFQAARRHICDHVPPARRQATMTAFDHLECALKMPFSKTTISSHSLQPPDGCPEQAIDDQVGQELHTMKYQARTVTRQGVGGSRARYVPDGTVNRGNQRSLRGGPISQQTWGRAGSAGGPDDLLSGRSSVGRGTSGVHQRETCPEALRTAEISSPAQTACRVHPSRSATARHKTRPTGRLVLP